MCPSPPLSLVPEEDAMDYEVGDKVEVLVEIYGSRSWHPATVVAVRPDLQRCIVEYDYEEDARDTVDWVDIWRRPLASEVEESEDDSDEERHPATGGFFFKAGDRVELLRSHPDYGDAWYPATVECVVDPESETYRVQRVSGPRRSPDEEEEEHQEQGMANFRPAVVESEFLLDLRHGAQVEVRCDGGWAIGVVLGAVGASQYRVAIGEKVKVIKEVRDLRPRYKWDWENREWSVIASFPPKGICIVELFYSLSDCDVTVNLMSIRKSHFVVFSLWMKCFTHALNSKPLGDTFSWEQFLLTIEIIYGCKFDAYPNLLGIKGLLLSWLLSACVKRPRSPVERASDDDERSSDPESIETKRSIKQQKHLGGMPDGSGHALVSNMDNVSGNTNCVLRKKVTTKKGSKRKFHLKKSREEQSNPHSSLDATTTPLSTMGICGSLSDQGLTATLNNSCQANRNEDEVATQLPFIKSLPAWSLFEEMEVFKKMPQQPHFGPLQKEKPIQHEGIALGLTATFAIVVECISNSCIEDNYESFQDKDYVFSQLKHFGFSVDKLQTCLNKLIEMKSEYAKHITERDIVQAQKQLKRDSCSKVDSLRDLLMRLGLELLPLAEEKKAREAEISELEEAESMVKKACHDIKERFGDTLAEYIVYTCEINKLGVCGSLSDQGSTAMSINSSSQANRNEDEVATQLPFIKSLPVWSSFEEMEVFKKMPQQPHFGPLQKEKPIQREGIALGLMGSFANVVESISNSSIEDNYESFQDKDYVLSHLKHFGFSVDKLQTCLNKLIEMKSEYAKHVTERDIVQAQKQLKGDSCSEIDNQRDEKIKMLMQLGQELQQLHEAKRAREAEFSELKEAESMVDKACQDMKEQFGDTLVEHLG
ncbi:hypothetical protein EJB05_23230, partial [Eragrostis curvula]